MNVTQASWTSKARTWLLLAALTALFIGIGFLLGGAFIWLFVAFSILMNVAAYFWSDKFAIRASGAKPVSEEEAPDLHKIVNELAELYQVPQPRVYMIPSEQPNAFATGRNPSHAAVAVTEGILKLLDRRQLEGVLAHELSHVQNRDVLIATIAAAVAGLVAALGHAIQWGAILGMGRRDDGEGGNPIAALAWALLAPLIALVVQLAVSRTREYGADASGAALVGDPEPLAEALLALEHGNEARPYEFGGPATAHLFIVNPFSGVGGKMLSLFSTHPPLEERVRRLRELKRGVRYG
jgi:heat shock protein HtpX